MLKLGFKRILSIPLKKVLIDFFPSIFSFHIDIHTISLVLAKSMYIKKHDKVSSFHIRPNACINIFDFYVYSLVEGKLGGKKLISFA